MMKFVLVSCVVLGLAVVFHHLWTRCDVDDNFRADLTYDYIVVGGGTAGCLLANRLSRNPTKRVLVVEAGDYPRGWTRLVSRIPIAVPFLIGSSIDWQFWTTRQQHNVFKALKDRRFGIPAGRVFGGSSVINAMIYARAHEQDYDEWRRQGLRNWSSQDVKQFYSRTLCGDTNDNESCLTVSEVQAVPELTDAFVEAGRLSGLSQGFVRPTVAVVNAQRATMFDAFIRPVLNRENLYRLTKHDAVKILLNFTGASQAFQGESPTGASQAFQGESPTGASQAFQGESPTGAPSEIPVESPTSQGFKTQAMGVQLRDEHGKITNVLLREKGEVILTAGAMASPKILMRSGIGPRTTLDNFNINTVVNLPVGEHVQDHPFVGLYFTINKTVSLTTRKLVSPHQLWQYVRHGTGHLSLASGLTGIGYLSLNATGNTSRPEVIPYAPDTKRPRDIELLSFGIGSIINDLMKTISNFDEESWELFKPPNYHQNQEGFLINVVLLKPKSRGRIAMKYLDEKPSLDLNHLSNPDDIKNLIDAVLYTIDLIESGPLYRAMGARVYLPVYRPCEGLAARSRAAIECLIRHVSVNMYHMTSSCRMGGGPRTSVVDGRLRVHGVGALRVADASVLPSVPSAHPVATIMMVAERAGQFLKERSQTTE